jgi:3-oxoacyl-[acyl-carrier protein] reductase
MSLINYHALITGGSKGIGNTIAKKISSLGCKVTLLSRNEGLLQDEVENLNKEYPLNNGKLHDYIKFDLKNPELIESFIFKNKNFQDINILINCAGMTQNKLLMNIPSNEIQEIMNVNLISPIILSKLFIKTISRKKTNEGIKKIGHIVNISSILSLSKHDLVGSTVYTATKAGLSRFTECAAHEQGEIHKRKPNSPQIYISCLTPGHVIDTDIGNSVKVDESSVEFMKRTTKEEIADQVAQLLVSNFQS